MLCFNGPNTNIFTYKRYDRTCKLLEKIKKTFHPVGLFCYQLGQCGTQVWNRILCQAAVEAPAMTTNKE